MRAIDDPLSEDVTRGSDDFRWIEDAKGSAVPENRTRHSRNTGWAWTGLTSHVRGSKRSLEAYALRRVCPTSRRGQHAGCRWQSQSKALLGGPPLH